MTYDYTENDVVTGGATANQADMMDNFEVGGVTMEHSADEIEASRARREPPPGDHEFIVVGFLKAPEMKGRTGYLNGQSVGWNSYMLGVRLALASDQGATVVDFFDLPPIDPREQGYYIGASKAPDGKNAGFMAEKFGHFISRLGFVTPKGQPIPPEARKPKNWIGRRVIATIELQAQKGPDGQPKMNMATGEPFAPRAQVKLFSYKPVMGQAVATTNVASPTNTAAPAVATPAPARPAPTPDRLAQLASQL
jgi:hypothetical protein